MRIMDSADDQLISLNNDFFDYHQEIARSAFADMLHDTERNQKYFHALKKAIDKLHARNMKANVLDIGTGTGLLSMMAVQCNADSVTACEAFLPMADGAEQIMKKNGMNNKIRIIKKRSTDIKLGTGPDDLWQKANILVTEVFDTELIGEGAIETFNHAHEQLLERDCIVVPDSGTVYVQVVESPLAWAWNDPKVIANLDGDVLLKTPVDILNCKGSSELHDIQLNQFPVNQFRTIVDPVAVFEFDWSGKSKVPKNENKKVNVVASSNGSAQIVFMWWILKMDQEGEIRLSCAPHWHHEDFKQLSEQNENSIPIQNVIPWRDHWMQAIFYLPKQIHVQKSDQLLLHGYHDEFSLWFDLTSNTNDALLKNIPRPLCECGFHLAYSRRRIGELNDNQRNKKWIKLLENEISNHSTVLFVSDGSLIGLSIAALNAKHVYYIETDTYSQNVLQKYIEYNNLKNIEVFNSIDCDIPFEQITHIIGEPNSNTSILPWDNFFLFGKLFEKIRNKVGLDVKIFPQTTRIMAVPVEFLDLQKICAPFGICESFDLALFDKIIENASHLTDKCVEAQPLWEYPNKALGYPKEIFKAKFTDFPSTSTNSVDLEIKTPGSCNGIALWTEYSFTDDFDARCISTGPSSEVEINKFIQWNMHTRQGVRLLTTPIKITSTETIKIQVKQIDGHFNFYFN